MNILNWFRKADRSKSETTSTEPVEEILHVSNEVMNAAFDRSAGRWCDHCGQAGSHHTDRHNQFALAATAEDVYEMLAHLVKVK